MVTRGWSPANYGWRHSGVPDGYSGSAWLWEWPGVGCAGQEPLAAASRGAFYSSRNVERTDPHRNRYHATIEEALTAVLGLETEGGCDHVKCLRAALERYYAEHGSPVDRLRKQQRDAQEADAKDLLHSLGAP